MEDPQDDPADPDGQRQCRNCGASLTQYSKFCSSCGTEQEPGTDNGQNGDGSAGETTGREGSGPGGPRGTPEASQEREQPGRDGPDRWGGQQGPARGGRGNRRGPDPQDRQGRDGGPGPQGQGGPRGNRQRQGGGPGRQEQGGPRGNRQRRGGGPRTGGGRGGPQRQQGGRRPDRLATAGPASDTDLAAVAHILGLFTGLLGTLLVYVVTDDPFVKQNAANATNWQIMIIVYSIVSFVLIFVLVGLLLLPLLVIVDFAFAIVATIKATDGEAWEYPLTPALV